MLLRTQLLTIYKKKRKGRINSYFRLSMPLWLSIIIIVVDFKFPGIFIINTNKH